MKTTSRRGFIAQASALVGFGFAPVVEEVRDPVVEEAREPAPPVRVTTIIEVPEGADMDSIERRLRYLQERDERLLFPRMT